MWKPHRFSKVVGFLLGLVARVCLVVAYDVSQQRSLKPEEPARDASLAQAGVGRRSVDDDDLWTIFGKEATSNGRGPMLQWRLDQQQHNVNHLVSLKGLRRSQVKGLEVSKQASENRLGRRNAYKGIGARQDLQQSSDMPALFKCGKVHFQRSNNAKHHWRQTESRERALQASGAARNDQREIQRSVTGVSSSEHVLFRHPCLSKRDWHDSLQGSEHSMALEAKKIFTLAQSSAQEHVWGRNVPGVLVDQHTLSITGSARLGPVRSHKFDLTDFGAVGDGVTDNTRAFQNAMYALSTVAEKGGGQLYVPPGVYRTGCFNLTSHMTLFLANGSVVEAIDDTSLWPILSPLPSYGRGREMPGPRYSSFIYGQNITDVIIGGENATIDGKGLIWWKLARTKQLSFSRGPLLQFLWSSDITISNLTLLNSPYWALHPVYSRNVTLEFLTISAPADAPNTGGILPDSCSDVVINGCLVKTGDDCVNVKSGWDEYGIAYNMSSNGIAVRNSQLFCCNCTALSIGSEMSGGVSNVLFENIQILESAAGFRLKTCPGRGGYVRGVTLRNVTMNDVAVAIIFSPTYGEHADDKYDPNALPRVSNFTFENVTGCSIGKAGVLEGLPLSPFREIKIKHMHLNLAEGGEGFSCRDVKGKAVDVTPKICKELQVHLHPLQDS